MNHKLTRITALMLAVIMSFSMLLVPVQAASFTDVPEKAWYKAAVDYVSEKGWMKGVGETTFAPSMDVTRAMFVTLLAAYAEVEVDNDGAAFADTGAGKWYTGSAAWAAGLEIVKGIGEGRFAPNRAITRQDLCVMLYKYLQTAGIKLQADADRTYADFDSVSAYAREAVGFCAASGLVTGFEDGSFRPKKTATRAQVAQILMRLDQLRQGQELPEDPMPAQSFNGEAGETMSVSVNAPEGALPENTKMTVSPVTDETALAAIQAQVSGTVYMAADITFTKDENEIEPAAEVEVRISMDGLENLKNPRVVHIKADGTVEPVSSELISITRGGDKALRFYARDFSVYAIVEGDDSDVQTYSIKYEFYTDSTCQVPFSYTDATGNETWFQYVGNGEYLYNPGEPEGFDNMDFVGWYAEDADADDDPEIPSGVDRVQKTVTESKVVKLYPKFEEPFYIEYRDEEFLINTTESNLFGSFTMNGRNVSLLESNGELRVSYQPNSSRNAFLGWAPYVPGKTNYSESEIISQVSFPAGENKISLAPVNKAVWWVQFNKNDDDNDDSSKASYTAPLYLLNNETVAQRYPGKFPDGRNGLPAPTRMGYTFDGWYYETTNNDGNMVVTEFTKDTRVTADMTVSAKWIASRADYTIVYWAQNASDEVDLPDDQKSYSFLDSTIVQSTTGSMVSLSNAQKNAKLSTGFHLNNVKTTAGELQVMANNSTVLNVYYDRDIFTLTFQVQGTGMHYVVDNSASSNIYGLKPDGSFQSLRRESDVTNYEVYLRATSLAVNNDYLIITTSGNQRLVLTNVYSSDSYSPYISQVSITNHPEVANAYNITLTNLGHGINLDNFLMRVTSRSGADCVLRNLGRNMYLSQSDNRVTYNNTQTTWTWGGNNNGSGVLHYDPSWVPFNDRFLRIQGSGNNQYVETIGEIASALGGRASFEFYRKTTQSVTKYRYYYTDTGEEYTGDRYVQQQAESGTWRNVKQYRALYEHSLVDIFPIQGVDGVNYENQSWDDSETTQHYGYVLKTVDVMPNANVIFHGGSNEPYKTIKYFVEVIPGEEQDPNKEYTTFQAADGVTRTYELYKTVRHNFNFLTYNEEYHPLVGFNRNPGGVPAFGDTYYLVSNNSIYSRSNSVRAPIPNYAWDPDYYYLYYMNNGRATRVAASEYGNYGDIWLNKLYYNRESYDLEFLDAISREPITANDTPVTLRMAFQQSLSAVNDVFTVSDDKATLFYNGTQLPGHEGYTFSGWYLDPGMTTRADLDTMRMPNGKLQLYAGWTINRYRVWLNPNGGEFGHTNYDDGVHGSGWRFTESTYFRTNWGTPVQKYEDVEQIGRKFVQDDANGNYVYVYICDPTNESLDAARAAYYKLESELGTIKIYNERGDVSTVNEANYTDGHRYVQQPGVYHFVGWYYATDLDLSDQNTPPVISDNDKLDLFDFNTPVVENMAIRALWKRIGRFRISYDVNMYSEDGTEVALAGVAGSGPAPSEYDHADLSTAPTLRAPNDVPDGYIFLGWKTPSGEIVQPNDLFTLYANLAVPSADSTPNEPKYEYKLTAVYQKLPTTSLIYDANGGEGTLRDLGTTQSFNGISVSGNTVSNLLVNREILLSTGDGFTYPGYSLIGWTDDVDENKNPIGTVFKLGGTYAIGTETTRLYAVWRPTPRFYVFHSSTGKLQAFSVPLVETGGEGGTPGQLSVGSFDITALVEPGYLYGGYYRTYGGVDMSAVEAAKDSLGSDAWSTGSLVSDRWEQLGELNLSDAEGFNAYDGSSLKNGTTRFWTKEDAYNETNLTGLPAGYEPKDVNGETMKPQAGVVYYLKEVPADKYLHSNFAYVFTEDLHNDVPLRLRLDHLFLLTGVDDTSYSKVGFRLDGNEQLISNDVLTPKFTLVQKECLALHIEAHTSSITAAEVCGGQRGYIAVKQMDALLTGSSFTMLPSWKTLDGVTVGNAPLTCEIDNDEVEIRPAQEQPVHEEAKLLYANLHQHSLWQREGDIYAFFQGTDKADKWVKMDRIGGTFVRAEIPEGYTTVILARCNPEAAQNIDVLDRSGTISIDATFNCISRFDVTEESILTEIVATNVEWKTYVH